MAAVVVTTVRLVQLQGLQVSALLSFVFFLAVGSLWALPFFVYYSFARTLVGSILIGGGLLFFPGVTLLGVYMGDSSTAGYGYFIYPLVMVPGALFASLIDRAVYSRRTLRSKPDGS